MHIATECRQTRCALCVVTLMLSGSTYGCTSVVVSGAAGFDAGTLGVSGIDAGVGVQTEAIGYVDLDGTSVGFGPAVEIAGYDTEGDADPIAFTTLDIRYRRFMDSRAGSYWAAGTGAGLAWSAGVRSAAIPLQVEVGISRPMGRTRLFAGIRNRFVGLIGAGSPPVDAFNSLQVILGIGFDEPRPSHFELRRFASPGHIKRRYSGEGSRRRKRTAFR